MFFSSGLPSFFDAFSLASRHASPTALEFGNGCASKYFCRYVLSISAVLVLSLKLLPLCPLFPLAVIMPCSLSMSLRFMLWSSAPSKAVSAKIVNIVAVFGVAEEIIISTFCFSGMIGIFVSQ